MPNLSHIMRSAWRLLRLSMRPYSRPVFGDCLRQAWEGARNAPVTPLADLQRWITVSGAETRDVVIQKLELARNSARARCGLYARAGAPTNWSAAKHRSADIQRLGGIEAILAREIAARDATAARYTAKRNGAGFVLKRAGVEFGHLTGAAGSLSFTSPDVALVDRVRSTLTVGDTFPAALAKVRAADEALRAGRVA